MEEKIVDTSSESTDSHEQHIVIIPMKMPENMDPDQELRRQSDRMRAILSGDDTYSESSTDNSQIEDQLINSTISFHSVSDDPSETLSAIERSSSVSIDESLEHAAKCGAFWRSLGVETLIYMSSYGAGILANGLIIRFAGLDSLAGTLLFGSYAALSFNQAQILFKSALKPPRDDVPKDRQECFQIMSKYAFLPISWVVRAGAAGTALSLIGDSDFGTQQAISVPSSLLVAPVITGLRTMTRECMGGSVELHPDYTKFKDVPTGFATSYSDEPNPLDDDRSRRYGTLRDAFVRGVVMNIGTLAFFAYSGNQLATYCIGGQEDFMNATANNSTADINALLNEHCAGGQFTFAFRELALSFTYGVGVLVVEPLLSGLMNSIYDCFYPRDDEESSSDEENPRIEEVTGSDSSDS